MQLLNSSLLNLQHCVSINTHIPLRQRIMIMSTKRIRSPEPSSPHDRPSVGSLLSDAPLFSESSLKEKAFIQRRASGFLLFSQYSKMSG